MEGGLKIHHHPLPARTPTWMLMVFFLHIVYTKGQSSLSFHGGHVFPHAALQHIHSTGGWWVRKLLSSIGLLFQQARMEHNNIAVTRRWIRLVPLLSLSSASRPAWQKVMHLTELFPRRKSTSEISFLCRLLNQHPAEKRRNRWWLYSSLIRSWNSIAHLYLLCDDVASYIAIIEMQISSTVSLW